jgi:predicted  nucleic acid-binding Zn-ribbon protein
MKEIIKKLHKLNELDIELQTLRKDLERMPRELAEKEEEPKLLKEQIERRKADILKLKMEADSIELEMKAGMEALKRYASQLNVLRTSKEFEAVKRQMEAQRGWNSENEDKALALLSQAEVKQKEADGLNTKLEEVEKVLAVERERVGKDVAELTKKQNDILVRRAELSKDVPGKELAIYDRIVVNRGQATAKVNKGFCSACHMKLPPQVHNMVLLAKELVTCPSCDRILTAE